MQLADIDLTDVDGIWARSMEERHEAFAVLREQAPISFFRERASGLHSAGPGYWALTRYDDVVDASRRPEDFCSGKGTNIPDFPPEFNEFFGSIVTMDDPRHARLRKLVSAGFTPRMLARVDQDVLRLATEIVDDIAERGSCDFVTEVASKFPLKIICRMMDIPEELHETVFNRTNIVLTSGDPEFLPPGANRATAVLDAGRDLAAIMDEVADRVRKNPGDDLTSALIHAEVDGVRLTREELQSFFVVLCAAGNETTRNAISWGLWFLTQNPDQADIWKQDFEGVSSTAVEEIVRFASPVIHFRRTATRDGVRIGEHEFSEGEKVVLFYPSANRDSAMFDDPDRFNVRRDPNNHLGYGGPGPHFCLGAHLARREISVMFRELFERLPDIHATSEPDRIRSTFINGIKHLDCAFTPAGKRG